MKDKWINTGYEGDDLKPHIEPVEDYSDPARIGELVPSNLIPVVTVLMSDLLYDLVLVVCLTQR